MGLPVGAIGDRGIVAPQFLQQLNYLGGLVLDQDGTLKRDLRPDVRKRPGASLRGEDREAEIDGQQRQHPLEKDIG